MKRISISEFLTLAITHPVLDVRSPGEFLHAHIPGAQSLPLFTDEERKVVGTAYKQESKQIAIKIGLKYFGVKMVEMVETVEQLFKDAEKNHPSLASTNKTILVHCWRGGMRSAGVAWLLDLYGYQVYTLQGGYKAYRNWVLQQFEQAYPIQILGGYTGSGKTELLAALQKKGEYTIDLEGLASHKGSSFGNIGLPPQPSQEHFENKLAHALFATNSAEQNALKPIWMEDESQRIGYVNIPSVLFQQMRKKRVFFLDIPFESRLDYINLHYGKFPKDQLVNAVIRIKKKLGGLETKNAINYLVEDDTKESFRILLQYYDKLYNKGLEKNRENIDQQVTKLACADVNAHENAIKLLNLAKLHDTNH